MGILFKSPGIQSEGQPHREKRKWYRGKGEDVSTLRERRRGNENREEKVKRHTRNNHVIFFKFIYSCREGERESMGRWVGVE